ncbi:MAG: CHAT domain-containing protein [Blastocatellia bacterium]
MQHQEYNKESLWQYLLGDLDEETRIVVEARLLLDNDYNDQLLIVEDELVEEYLNEDISVHDLEKFIENYLPTPDGQIKMRLSEGLKDYCGKNGLNTTTDSEPPSPILARLIQFISRPMLAGIAALILLGIGIGIWRTIFRKPSDQAEIIQGVQLLNSAFREQRPFETRISGFSYAPWPIQKGIEESKIDRLAYQRADRFILDAVAARSNSSSQQAAGQLSLAKAATQLARVTKLSTEGKDTRLVIEEAKDDLKSAIEHFQNAVKIDPNNSRAYSDLGMAYLEKGKLEALNKDSSQSLIDLAESRKQLDTSLKLNSQLLEALFNLALLHQTQRLWAQAEESWRKYLENDSSSHWAEEAGRYLNIAVEEQKKQASKTREQILAEFLQAHQSNDENTAWQIIGQNREAITGKLVWWQLTGEFLNASSNGQNSQTDILLKALQFAGQLEYKNIGDPFTSQLARFYQSSAIRRRNTLAQARRLTQQGHDLCLDSKYDEAISHYIQAKGFLQESGNAQEASFVDYLLSQCYLQTSQREQSLTLLKRLIQACENNKYKWLQAQAFNTLAVAHTSRTEYSLGIKYTDQALEISKRVKDPYCIQKNFSQLANQRHYLNDYYQSLSDLRQSLEIASVHWPGYRQMWRNYETLTRNFSSLQYYAAAADCQKEALHLAQKEFRDPAQLYLSYVHLGYIYGKLQRYADAIKYVQQGFDIARSRSDQAGGQARTAYASLQLAHLYRQTKDFDRALVHYDQAIKWYQEVGNQVNIYDAHKGRLLCYLTQKNEPIAENELKVVLDYAEKYRTNILAEKHRNTFFDAEQSVYDIAIGFEHRRGNFQAAFDYSEASRARSLLDLMETKGQVLSDDRTGAIISPSNALPFKSTEIQGRLPDHAQILQYAVLEDRLLVWVISKTGFNIVEKRISSSELQEIVLNYQKLIASPFTNENKSADIRREAMALYDILIAPIEPLLDKEKLLCIVPDKVLYHLPLNTLIAPASGKYLIHDYLVSFSPSSSIFLRCFEEARRREGIKDEVLLSIGNPSFNRREFPTLPDLPESASEAAIVAKQYRSNALTGPNAKEGIVRNQMPRSDVVHLSSHYVTDERSPMLSKLLLAEEPKRAGLSQGEDGILQAGEIYSMKLPRTRLVVLSACRSGIERYYNGEGMIGMSRTFIVSGVPLVVASLWPVDSSATAELMINFHKYRKQSGRSTAEALRYAQLDMINKPQQRNHHPYYWAPFILIGGYAGF